MQTVNFQCGHCGNLMAVTTDFLGQQVRCPHCQQIVVAPAVPDVVPTAAAVASSAPLPPSPPAPEEMPFHFAAAEERESIFTPDEQASEDVFGVSRRPVVEMPPPVAPPPPAPPPPVLQDVLPVAPAPVPPLEPANPFAGLSSPPPARLESQVPVERSPAISTNSTWPAHEAAPWTDTEPAGADHDHRHEFHDPAPPRIATPRANSGWMLIAFVVPLVSYAILVTILAAVQWWRLKTIPHPFEALPDTEGENIGAKKTSALPDRIKPENKLPDQLRVALGRSIRVGDLEITPQRVELTKIRYRYPNGKTDDARNPSLVLHLQMRNVSDNVAFHPTDPVFLRSWKPGKAGGMPYTFLEMGEDRRFYGGPIRWSPEAKPGQRADVSVVGHNPDRLLPPRETMTTLVCTDPEDRIAERLKGFTGQFLWRVQFRRGLVHRQRGDTSATAVIGVEFSHTDIPRRGS